MNSFVGDLIRVIVINIVKIDISEIANTLVVLNFAEEPILKSWTVREAKIGHVTDLIGLFYSALSNNLHLNYFIAQSNATAKIIWALPNNWFD